MIHSIRVTNVSQALYEGTHLLFVIGREEDSRAGRVLAAPDPFITQYTLPQERVLFSPLRDANPFFHLMEALWMLGGRNNLAFPARFNKNFGVYSSDGLTLHGAYGNRWRNHFGLDQLEEVADLLINNPGTRRSVLAMWDPECDLNVNEVDIPCNTHAYFRINSGKLDMTVCNRSNDMIWGAYGANAVHMSMLQELMAAWIDVGIGTYTQISNNMHIYLDKFPIGSIRDIGSSAKATDKYKTGECYPRNLVDDNAVDFLEELDVFLAYGTNHREDYREGFFPEVAVPILAAWEARVAGDMNLCFEELGKVKASDWRVACTEWVARREK